MDVVPVGGSTTDTEDAETADATDADEVREVAEFPDDPTSSVSFGIYGEDVSFNPLYYPERFSITTEKELQRVKSACEGETVDIEKLKNSTLHVSGRLHTSDLADINALAQTPKPVEVITPLVGSSGMEAYVKMCERGEMAGYDAYPRAEEWMFQYTLDLVSTGVDEYHSHNDSSTFELSF